MDSACLWDEGSDDVHGRADTLSDEGSDRDGTMALSDEGSDKDGTIGTSSFVKNLGPEAALILALTLLFEAAPRSHH